MTRNESSVEGFLHRNESHAFDTMKEFECLIDSNTGFSTQHPFQSSGGGER